MTGVFDGILSGLVEQFNDIRKELPELENESLLGLLKPAIESVPYPVIVSDVEHFKPAYMNAACRRYTDLTEEQAKLLDNRFYYKYVHQDSIQIVPQGVAHFTNQAHLPYHVCYKVVKNNRQSSWIYVVTHALSFRRASPKNLEYMISVFMDIEHLIMNDIRADFNSNSFMKASTGSLSLREKEILCLFGKELSIEEIALRMRISPNTVKTYRQKIMHKLGVKSGVGLGRFSMLLEEI